MADITDALTQRNYPIVREATQRRLREARVLIAGCGLGSCIAESLVRLGVNHLVLVDNDQIELHNLNRQSFGFDDVGQSKVVALERRLQAINPQLQTEAAGELLNRENARRLVRASDIVIDTIDFLDLSAIIALHDEALEQKKPVISLFTAGWGAVGMFIPPEGRTISWAREVFDATDVTAKDLSYKEKFSRFFTQIQSQLNPSVAEFMKDVLKGMLDNKPCPAPNVIAGAQLASVLAQTFLVKHLEETKLVEAPQFVYLDLDSLIKQSIREIGRPTALD